MPPAPAPALPRSVLLCALLASLAPGAFAADPKPLKVEIEIIPGALRFATARFDATAGGPLEITLKNSCIMPHNLVLARPGKADEIVTLAMAMTTDGMARNYVPSSPEVLAATKLLNPGTSETIKLTAPAEPGDYPYLCTFPGHGTIMRGIMRVRKGGEKLEAALTEKFDKPKLVDALKASGVNSTPMGTREHPFVLRSFVPNVGLGEEVLAHHERGLPARLYNPTSGKDTPGKDIAPEDGIPAGIAVNFGPGFSYVWDATECRLLYAWTGGFLDMSAYWGKGTGGARRGFDYRPELAGQLVYKAAGPLPLQLGDTKARPKFRGYRLLNGAPEFTYEIGGTTVHEHIVPGEPGNFSVNLRLERPPEPVRLAFTAALRQQINCGQGTWKGDTLEVPADHADFIALNVRFAPGESFKPDPNKKASTSGEP